MKDAERRKALAEADRAELAFGLELTELTDRELLGDLLVSTSMMTEKDGKIFKQLSPDWMKAYLGRLDTESRNRLAEAAFGLQTGKAQQDQEQRVWTRQQAERQFGELRRHNAALEAAGADTRELRAQMAEVSAELTKGNLKLAQQKFAEAQAKANALTVTATTRTDPATGLPSRTTSVTGTLPAWNETAFQADLKVTLDRATQIAGRQLSPAQVARVTAALRANYGR